MDRVLADIEYVGEDAEQRLEASLHEFLGSESPLQQIKKRFSQLPRHRHFERWKLVYLASRDLDNDSVRFLESIVREGPSSSVPTTEDATDEAPSTTAQDQSTGGYEVHLAAARGVVRAAIQGVPSASAAVDSLLATVDRGIANIMAGELSVAGALTPERRAVLSRRNIPMEYRLLAEEEWRERGHISPGDLTVPDERKKATERQRMQQMTGPRTQDGGEEMDL